MSNNPIPILIATEKACAALALSASVSSSLGFNVYRGMSNKIKEAPAIVCKCNSATEDFPFSAIWHVNTDIEVKEMAADTDEETIGENAAVIFEAFLNSDSIQNLINTIPDYYVYDIQTNLPVSNEIEEGVWVQTLPMSIVCCLK